MSGTMGGMYVGVSGLMTSQNALNTTAHNLTNVNTEGFSRQQLLLTDLTYNRIGSTAVNVNTVGLGTTIGAVRQVRDNFLDTSYRQETGRHNYYLAQYEAIDEVQNYFGEMEGSSFRNCMKNLWTSMQEVQKESNSVVTRSSLISTASTFIERANSIHKQLVEYQTNLNTQISDQVDRINKLADTIHELNIEIIKVEASGIESASDYRDQRNKALDELGGLIDIDVTSNQDGSVDVYAENRCLVTLDRTFKMTTASVSSDNDFIKPVWQDDQTDVFNFNEVPSTDTKTDIGSLKGLLISRGESSPDYTDIPVKPVQSDYNNVADYNAALAQYESDTAVYNKTVEPFAISNIIAQFDRLIHGIVTEINDVLSPNKEITLSDGSTMKVLDEEKAGIGMGEGNDISGTELFVRKSVSRYTDKTVTLADNSVVTVKAYNEESSSNYYSMYTLENIGVNDELVKNPSLLPLNTSDQGEDQAKADQLLSLWEDDFSTLNPNTLIVNNFTDYYAVMIEDFANKGYTYNALAESYSSTSQEIDSQRQQVVGVSSDEELSNLIKFQQAYNASSRYVTTVSEMIEHIIEKLG